MVPDITIPEYSVEPLNALGGVGRLVPDITIPGIPLSPERARWCGPIMVPGYYYRIPIEPERAGWCRSIVVPDIAIPGIPLSLNALGGGPSPFILKYPHHPRRLTSGCRSTSLSTNLRLTSVSSRAASAPSHSTFVLGVTLAGGTLESGIREDSVAFGLEYSAERCYPTCHDP